MNATQTMQASTADGGRADANGPERLGLRVRSRAEEAPGVASIELEPADGSALPEWSAGAHIDVHTPHGPRQYSLCGRPGEWRIAVLDEPAGRGGSRWVHDVLHPGAEVTASRPRDAFRFAPAPAYLFVAGGIGITPILPMLEEADRRGTPWRLLYTVRETGAHAFAERLDGRSGVTRWVSGAQGRADLGALLDETPSDAAIYSCGPSPLLDALRDAAASRDRAGSLRVERFAAAEPPQAPAGEAASPYRVTMRRTGRTFDVGPDEVLLDRLGAEGAFVPSSCRAGICGSCEVAVVSGEIDHRDEVLTDEERAENSCMFPCVSRALRGQDLVLDV